MIVKALNELLHPLKINSNLPDKFILQKNSGIELATKSEQSDVQNLLILIQDENAWRPDQYVKNKDKAYPCIIDFDSSTIFKSDNMVVPVFKKEVQILKKIN